MLLVSLGAAHNIAGLSTTQYDDTDNGGELLELPKDVRTSIVRTNTDGQTERVDLSFGTRCSTQECYSKLCDHLKPLWEALIKV